MLVKAAEQIDCLLVLPGGRCAASASGKGPHISLNEAAWVHHRGFPVQQQIQ